VQTCAEYWQFLLNIQSAAWLEWAKATFDLIKGIAWPLAAFFVVWLFREQIKAKFPDVVQLGPTGAVFQISQQQSSQSPNPLQASPHPLQTVNALVETIQAELQGYVLDQREPRLVRALAEARVLAEFENIFGSVFQSQIDALKVLASGQKTTQEAQAFFTEEVVPKNKELYAQFDFDKWATFLVINNLVQVTNDEITITQKGLDFLDFVRTKKAAYFRPN
jgi:hypothetical protein